jgi:hypothetical protein
MTRVLAPGAFRSNANRLIPVIALAVCLTPAFAISPIVPAGAVKGVVSDISGSPRMGAVVLLFNRQDMLIRRAVTNGDGGSSFCRSRMGMPAR